MVTPLAVDGTPYELLAWGRPEERRGWLCHPPHSSRLPVHELHRELLTVCGGNVERFGEPDSFWMNQNEVLTKVAAGIDLAAVFAEYAWLWEDEGLALPIDPREHFCVAVEANGNLTLAHRRSGAIALFAPDHDLTRVTPLPGCPEYSLMTIDDVPDLATWLEVTASTWG